MQRTSAGRRALAADLAQHLRGKMAVGFTKSAEVRSLGIGVALVALSAASDGRAQDVQVLHDGWQIQSQAKAPEGGAAISSAEYKADGWLAAAVPSTVVGAQVAAKILPDPFFGMSIRDLPGVTYPVAQNFSHFPM